MTKAFNTMHFDSKSFKKLVLFPNVNVSPDLAKDLLTLNDINRPIKNQVVDKYTKEMKEGEWEFTGDVIQISKEGKLINGQHRLLAIINSGSTQIFHIQTGLEPKAFNYMDIGKIRSAGDTLATSGYKSYSTVATMVKYITMYDNGLLFEYVKAAGGASKYKFTNQEINDAAHKLDKDLLEKCARLSHKYYARAKFMDGTITSSLLYIYSRKNPAMAEAFFDMLSTGDGTGMDKNAPIYILRNRLINSATSGSKLDYSHKWALYIKAWNFFKAGKNAKQLGWSEGVEPFPIPV